MLFGSRVTQAREFNMLNQAQLADIIEIPQPKLSDIERGRFQPSTEVAERIALALRFPLSFFEHDVPPHFAIGTLEFRSRAATSIKKQRHAHQYAHISFELAGLLGSRLKLPPIRLPRVEGDPERAAAIVRSELGLSPDGSIKNLCDVLERSGILVLALPPVNGDSFDGVDGFSVWASNGRKLVPSIFVSTNISGDRQRLTIAHELGELCVADMPPGREREKTANRFAGAFLMPADRFREELLPPFSIFDFVEMKSKYGVSVQAALVRARHLNLIDDRRYHALYQQLSARGWRKQEPLSEAIPAEKPRGLYKMAELLYGDPVDFARLAQDSHLDPWLLRSLFAAHASRADLKSARPPGKLLQFRRSGEAPIKADKDEATQ